MILCLSHSNDFYTVDIVQRSCLELGHATFRLNTDEFATNYQLDYTLEADSRGYCLSTPTQQIYAAEISAVWYRKMWELTAPKELDPAYKLTFINEYQTALQLFLNAIASVPWINPMHLDHAVGGDKLHQLTTAAKVGFHVPKTLLSNTPGSIRDFYNACEANVIMKLHGALSKSMAGNTPFLPTTKLSGDDLAYLDEMAYCPLIFQEYIPKAYELRIIYIDGALFTGKIPHDEGKVDWRVTTGKPFQWEPYDLPTAVKQKISAMMAHLGLPFGAIDMIRHTDGRYVFLEVNPQGEWGMLQKHLGYPIGETIAEKLINRITKHD